jgi:hypothetical protein
MDAPVIYTILNPNNNDPKFFKYVLEFCRYQEYCYVKGEGWRRQGKGYNKDELNWEIENWEELVVTEEEMKVWMIK